jgi:phosphomannomutase
MEMLKLLDTLKNSLEVIVEPLTEEYFSSGEINYTVNDSYKALKIVEESFFSKSDKILKIDGLSVYTEFYFFNIRKSNTEPLVRLNIEGNSPQVVDEVKEQIEKLIL